MSEYIEDARYCEIMRELWHVANHGVVPWEWLEEYAKAHPVCYPADFIYEAKEVFRHERASEKS